MQNNMLWDLSPHDYTLYSCAFEPNDFHAYFAFDSSWFKLLDFCKCIKIEKFLKEMFNIHKFTTLISNAFSN